MPWRSSMEGSKIYGIDTNINLKEGYDKLKLFLNERSSTEINMYFCDAVNFDFQSLQPYDMIFTSPPYYLLEKYSHFEHCDQKKNKMDIDFYQPLFLRSYKYLNEGGHMVLNVNKEIYEKNCIPLFWRSACYSSFKKSKRQNNYSESIYVWKK